jgi:GNAT superfamily N-acetyltransferase
MNKMNIRELKIEDMQKMFDLLRTREELNEEGARKRTQLMEWLAFKNPFAGNEPTYFIAEDNGKIVAHLGRMPNEFIIQGKLHRAYFSHDLLVHPEYRKKGLGLFLTMSLYKAIEENSNSFCCLIWTSELNLDMQRRRGYYETKAGCYLKVFNPEDIIRRLLKKKTLIRVLSPLLKGILILTNWMVINLIPSHRIVTKVNRLDSRFDAFYRTIVCKMGICTNKSSAYLNWKFIDRPFNKTVVFEAREKGNITGYIILAPNLGKEFPEGMIVDIIVDPEDTKTIISLLKESVKYFRRQRVYSIRCCLTDKRFIKVLRRFQFLSLPRGEPVMLANLKKYENKEILMEIKNWSLTYSESDEMMLRA